MIDYDLIVLGGTSVGRYAAAKANRWGARVALIEPASSRRSQVLPVLHQINDTWRNQWLHRWQAFSGSNSGEMQFNWPQIMAATEAMAETIELTSPLSLPQLALQGIEVILADSSFSDRPQLGLIVNDRWLRSRTYLLTPATEAIVPPIPGLNQINYATLNSLAPNTWPALPKQLLILGRDPHGLMLAQVMNRLGTQVTIVTGHDRLLSIDDLEVINLLQAQLEAEGVTLLPRTQLTQIKPLNQHIEVKTADRTIETESILLATPPQLRLDSLNLEAAGVKWQPQRIITNHKLQTTQSRIYACGECLGSYASSAIDSYEADLALHNAFFWPHQTVNYRAVPWSIATDPQYVQIGLSETQAQQRYGQEIFCLQQPLKALETAQLQGDLTGFLKLITRRNGEILGVQALGTTASEWISPIALAIQNQLTVNDLARSLLSPTNSDLIRQAALQMQYKLRPDWKRELLETWFNFRRSR